LTARELQCEDRRREHEPDEGDHRACDRRHQLLRARRRTAIDEPSLRRDVDPAIEDDESARQREGERESGNRHEPEIRRKSVDETSNSTAHEIATLPARAGRQLLRGHVGTVDVTPAGRRPGLRTGTGSPLRRLARIERAKSAITGPRCSFANSAGSDTAPHFGRTPATLLTPQRFRYRYRAELEVDDGSCSRYRRGSARSNRGTRRPERAPQQLIDVQAHRKDDDAEDRQQKRDEVGLQRGPGGSFERSGRTGRAAPAGLLGRAWNLRQDRRGGESSE